MSESNTGNFVLAGELRAIADICDQMDRSGKTAASTGDISFGDIPVYDANGEGIGKITMTSCGSWGYDPW